MTNLVLIGFMGSGKSTIGRQCAARLDYAFRDSDKVIERRAGMPIARLFAERGEAAFRKLEREAIADLACESGLVIATGGGAILDAENVANLRAGGLVVLLNATAETLLARVGNRRSRPLLAGASDPRARIEALLTARLPHYERAAHYRLDTTGRDPEEIAEEIAVWYRAELEKRETP